jgi:hypothetical protein
MGTSLFGLKPKNTYQSLLKTTGNTAIDGTLKTISDGLGNDTPLQLSLTDTQINSTLRVHTDNAELLDLEDVASNNRFNINRDVQKINLDFASNPGGSTTQVGAIRTYKDGVNLSDSMSFIKDGSIGIGTTSPLGLLHLKTTAATTRMVIDADAGQSRIITYRTSGLQRFGLYVNNTAESGSNVGSDFAIRAYNDAGNLLSTPLFIKRSTQNVGLGTLSPTARTHIVGSGSTSATTSLLVQNSAGNQVLRINDGNQVIVGSATYYAPTGGLQTATTIYCPSITNSDGASGLNITGSPMVTSFDGSGAATLRLNGVYPLLGSRNYSGLSVVNNIFETGTPTTATYKSINLTQTVNQTLGTGKTWGLYIDHTVTAAVDHTIAEFIQGTNSIQFIQNNSSSVMALNSTTKGFLPPRMTTAQKNAILTPAAGLMVYDTNLNKLCVRTAAAWETITSI